MPRVIILEPTSLVVTSAKDFGEIVFVSELSRFNLFNIDDIIEQTKDRLELIKYNPDEDFICLTGNAQKVAIFVAVISGMYSEFSLLLFDAREAKYKERKFRNGSRN